LGLVPDIINAINMVPVDHVSLCITVAAISPRTDSSITVLQLTARPAPTFNDLFSSLEQYGYVVKQCDYLVWRRMLEKHVMEAQDNALFPLLHFVMDDLPGSTLAPALDDSNTVALMLPYKATPNVTVTDELLGRYLAWLVWGGFLPPPSTPAPNKQLPSVDSRKDVKAAGRTGM
jgi:L-aminoadipate-semialdehyde dehydrogenase